MTVCIAFQHPVNCLIDQIQIGGGIDKAISQAIELAKAEQRDLKEAIVGACPWSDKNTTQALIWLQESHAVLWEEKLWDLPQN